MSTVDLLKAARARIERPEAWTQVESARDASGHPVGSTRADAVCWCILGALSYAGAAGALGDDGPPLRELRATLGGDLVSISEWNDAPDRTHAEVIDLFDRTIARLESGLAPAHDPGVTPRDRRARAGRSISEP